jgi:hypothetical protein
MIAQILEEALGDAPGWVALFMQIMKRVGSKPADAATKVVEEKVLKQEMPNAFGFGLKDERMLESLRQLLPPVKRHYVDLVIAHMRDYEERIFRLILTGMPAGKYVEQVPVKKPPKEKSEDSKTEKSPAKSPPKEEPVATTTKETSWEFTPKDLRVKYLEDIADEVNAAVKLGMSDTEAATEVVEGMRARRLITRSKSAQWAVDLWVTASEWTEGNILHFFDVEHFSDLTDKVMEPKLLEYVNSFAGRHSDVLQLDAKGKLHAKLPGTFKSVINGFKFWR